MSENKLKNAVATGQRTVRARQAETARINREADEARRSSRATELKKWKAWLVDGDRLYKMVRKAVANGSKVIELHSSDIGATPNEVFADAVRSFKGFHARHESYDVDYGDSSAPCSVTEHKVIVAWSTEG
jgi:hypothetical protein